MALWWRAVHTDDKPNDMIDKAYALRCPHCGAHSNLTAISTPRWGQIARYGSQKVIIGYHCDACREPVALKFEVNGTYGNASVNLSEEYQELERPMETFEYQHLPPDVASDFREALTSYSHGCFNAAAAMCRRTIQSAATDLGAPGKAKVQKQILDAKELAGIDDDTFSALEEIMVGGHDGSHPNLPTVTPDRAALLVEMMKDVLRQLYVRRASIQAASQLRQKQVEAKRAEKGG